MKPTRRNISARLIGETSAGMSALEIWEGDELVYSHDYFPHCATREHYDRVMTSDIYRDMVGCAGWREYDSCDWEQPGGEVVVVVEYDVCDTTGVICYYYPETGEWELGHNLGQGWEFVARHSRLFPEQDLHDFFDGPTPDTHP